MAGAGKLAGELVQSGAFSKAIVIGGGSIIRFGHIVRYAIGHLLLKP